MLRRRRDTCAFYAMYCMLGPVCAARTGPPGPRVRSATAGSLGRGRLLGAYFPLPGWQRAAGSWSAVQLGTSAAGGAAKSARPARVTCVGEADGASGCTAALSCAILRSDWTRSVGRMLYLSVLPSPSPNVARKILVPARPYRVSRITYRNQVISCPSASIPVCWNQARERPQTLWFIGGLSGDQEPIRCQS